jgi:hypothetical protein
MFSFARSELLLKLLPDRYERHARGVITSRAVSELAGRSTTND